MSDTFKNVLIGIVCAALVVFLGICCFKAVYGTAGGVNYKLFREANDFNVYRRITVMNTRTDEIMMQMEGYISLSNNDTNELVITMKTGEDNYTKSYIYLNEWTCYAVEQIEPDTDSVNEITYYPRLRGES
jgi:hypothetical protein